MSGVKPKIILIGDSIRMGYQPTVIEQLSAIADVSGPEENGGTSENILVHMDEWIISQSPDIVHINCGLHDIKNPFDASAIDIPIDRYETNVRTILGRLKDESGAQIVWATTTPVNEQRHRAHKDFLRFNADVSACNEAAKKLAVEFGARVNDLHSTVTEAGPDKILLEDGVHYSEEGYALLGKTVADFLKPLLKGA